jgi:hypothetical protein
MDSVDLAQIERRARWRYEWARLKSALVGFAPVLLIVAVVAMLGHRPSVTAALGFVTFAGGVAMLWYGRDLKRAVLPGVAAGLVPLVLALCASHYHHCDGETCVSFCVPACSAGGVLAGLVVAAVGHRQRAGAMFWLSSSGLALLTGAMGCSCVGYAGVVGLAIGFGAGLSSSLIRRRLARTP